MIVIDASAAVALLLAETAQSQLAQKLAASAERGMSPVSYAELVMALSKVHPHPKIIADAFMRDMQVALLTIDQQQSDLAVHAFLLFGKGRHPTRLNLGDCFSYAAAKAYNVPLLFIGRDFPQTDVLQA
ncbi:MAG: type II toxin-antitoxin system VapC family toxin [Rhizomicrobium sp.]